MLCEESWVYRKWAGPKQLTDKKTKSLMMLPSVLVRIFQNLANFSTDMCLIQDKSFKQYATKYAKNEDEFFKEYVPLLAHIGAKN